MHELSGGLVLGYHGCASSTADKLIAGANFKASDNDYDWLGPGIYFWESNPKRAAEFAIEAEKRKRPKAPRETAVVGAVLNLGLCLDLLTKSGQDLVRNAYLELSEIAGKSGKKLPQNSPEPMLNKLDCAVIRYIHDVRSKTPALPDIDSVRGVFIEGAPLYDTSAFHDRTHIQIAICNTACIKGVFRVSDSELS